jgi:hypothetical protein
MRTSTQEWAINLINPIREFSIAARYTGTIGAWRKSFGRG